jgi:putative nucleotidyltransferase with HDIG domain
MPSILFVDDEPNVLAGLRRMLRSRRGDWDMQFCESGVAALELLAAAQADAVVTDMRMPGMDGAELLSQVRRLYPDTVRIILSGHSDQEMTLRAVGPAHRYLAKPCDPSLLADAITSSLHLHASAGSVEVRRLIESIDSLPSLPEVYVELVNEANNPNACIQSAGEIVARDLGLSAKILQLVNSSFFGLPVRVLDVPQAVALLGLGVVRPLVLSAGVLGNYVGRDLGSLSLGWLTDHSMQVAIKARELALSGRGTLTSDETSDIFLGGLLHDLGRLILAQHRPDEYSRIINEAASCPESLVDIEIATFGASHAEVGGQLLQLWGLPSTIVEAVQLHHKPSQSQSETYTALTAIHAAEVNFYEAVYDMEYCQRLGLIDRPAA